jgi:GMP synthase-like glutamine amidotransferase
MLWNTHLSIAGAAAKSSGVGWLVFHCRHRLVNLQCRLESKIIIAARRRATYMRVHVLQHVAFEGLGHIGKLIDDQGHGLAMTRLYAGESLPDLADLDRLVIMGGPMNIYEDDRFPWLAEERAFIRRAIMAGKSALGICLGAQLLADALGSRVYPGRHKEIGWLPIRVTEAGKISGLWQDLPSSPVVFHWHGDTFDVPAGAIHLARSEGCGSQAFLFENRILGLQFHLESTPDTVRELLIHCGDEVVDGPFIQSRDQIVAAEPSLFAANHHLLESLFSRLD